MCTISFLLLATCTIISISRCRPHASRIRVMKKHSTCDSIFVYVAFTPRCSFISILFFPLKENKYWFHCSISMFSTSVARSVFLTISFPNISIYACTPVLGGKGCDRYVCRNLDNQLEKCRRMRSISS